MDPIFLVLCHVCILFFITAVDVVKDIYDNHQHKDDSDDDESVDGDTKLPSRSLPRQWSNLQLVRTDSSLAKNSSHIEIVDHTTMRTPIEKKKSIQEVAKIDGREMIEQEFQAILGNETLATLKILPINP